MTTGDIAGCTCGQTLVNMASEEGTEVTTSTQPPLVAGPYTTDAFVCPHGVRWWIEPTGEQIAQWVKDGAA